MCDIFLNKTSVFKILFYMFYFRIHYVRKTSKVKSEYDILHQFKHLSILPVTITLLFLSIIFINFKKGPHHAVSNHVLPPILFCNSSGNSKGTYCPSNSYSIKDSPVPSLHLFYCKCSIITIAIFLLINKLYIISRMLNGA